MWVEAELQNLAGTNIGSKKGYSLAIMQLLAIHITVMRSAPSLAAGRQQSQLRTQAGSRPAWPRSLMSWLGPGQPVAVLRTRVNPLSRVQSSALAGMSAKSWSCKAREGGQKFSAKTEYAQENGSANARWQTQQVASKLLFTPWH